MSVVMYLSKPLYDVDYLGSKFDFATDEDIKRINELKFKYDMSESEEKEWEEMFARKYSDNKNHSYIDISWYYWVASLSKSNKAAKRYAKKLEKLGYKVFTPKHSDAMKYIVVDEVAYRQGWFFKNNFFNRGATMYVGTTKEEMIWFFKKYVDFNNKRDNRATEAYNSFLNAWEDGMIFVCSF